MSHVFVSYSRKDKAIVDKMVARLIEDGLDVWIDREEIKGGDLWREAIVKAVDDAYAFVLMLSSASVASENVRKEADLAEGSTKEIVPVLLAPVELSDRLRYQLAGIQWIEYYNDQEAKYLELVEVLRTHQPRPGAKTPDIREVEFVLKGLNLSQFGHEKQEQLLDLIADFTSTPRAHIRLEKLTAGSVHAFVSMPATAAYQIKTAALNRNARLITKGIDALRLSGDRHFVLLQTGHIAALKTGKRGCLRWLLGGLALLTLLFLSVMIIAVAMPKEVRRVVPSSSITPTFRSTTTFTPKLTFNFTPTSTPTATDTLTATPSPTPTLTSTPNFPISFPISVTPRTQVVFLPTEPRPVVITPFITLPPCLILGTCKTSTPDNPR